MKTCTRSFQNIAIQLKKDLFKHLDSTILPVPRDFAAFERPNFDYLYHDRNLNARQIAILRQMFDFEKRSVVGSSQSDNEARDEACWLKFKKANSSCGAQNENFANLDNDVMITLEYARNLIYNGFWTCFESEDSPFLMDDNYKLLPVGGFCTGPGSCSGVRGISTVHKYSNDWYASSYEGVKYLHYLRRVHKPISDLRNLRVARSSDVKAQFVLKSHDISRLIAPQLNGDLMLQYPAEELLCLMLEKQFNIDIESQQQKNREMARKGSLNDNTDIFEHSFTRRAMRFCTIDLSSASDLIGIDLVRYLLPPPLFNYLEMCRCNSMIGFNGETQNLNMMATMGNSYCFPLMTLVFASLVEAIYYRQGLKRCTNRVNNYAVYGDDIIVDVTAYDSVIKYLKLLGMEPNVKKCFSTGFFRESCGGDYFHGYDVRPVFIEEYKDDCDKYSLINRLLDWSVRHSVDISVTISLILKDIGFKTVTPLDAGPHEGLRVPECTLTSLPKAWVANVKCAAYIDRSITYTYSGNTHFYRGKTIMPTYSYQTLEREGGHEYVDLREYYSLFPFLRGGISQCKGYIYKVTSRKGAGHISKHLRTVPHWDPCDVESLDYAVYNWNICNHYGYTLLRVFSIDHPLTDITDLG